MFKRLLNHGTLRLELSPQGAALIKSGRETVDPSQPDMAFVRSYHPEVGDTVFFPGTGIKGALRSHAERLLYGLGVAVCDPVAKDQKKGNSHGGARQPAGPSCKRAGRPDTTPTSAIFKRQCPVCRTFGSLTVSGRMSVLDAFPWQPLADAEAMRRGAVVANRTERRTQVAIDRETGQAVQSGGLFEIEVITGGRFFAEIPFRNIQLWQLALIFVLVRALDEGDFGLGFGKARGLGRMRASLGSLRFESVQPATAAGSDGEGLAPWLHGVANLASGGEVREYGLVAEDPLELSANVSRQPTWRGSRLELSGSSLARVGDLLIEEALPAAIDHFLARSTNA